VSVRVPSSDHVSVAVHAFGGSGRPLLFAHATGFHAHCYLPMADALAERFTSYGLDFRGHGDTPRATTPPPLDWRGYGDDAEAAARAIAPDGGLVAFGHSMGGAGLLMAASRNPRLFDTLVLFEPIVFPAARDDGPIPLVAGARKRRASFPSFEEALANFASKPPMIAFDPDVLRLYVAHGFRPSPEGVRLVCDPEHEAQTFETGGLHRTWDDLPSITTRTVVVAGPPDGDVGPAAIARPVAERLPHGTFVELPDSNHFGPFVDPERLAHLVADAVR
jgi:pimeloyl-ACP methyl ester carboxylesterase